jgi:hypothetical protein
MLGQKMLEFCEGGFRSGREANKNSFHVYTAQAAQ